MLKYLYYRFYKFFDFIESHSAPESIRIPEYLAFSAISMLIALNIATIDVVIHSYTDSHVFLGSTRVAMTFYASIVLILYVLLLRKKKYLSIVEKYSNESLKCKRLSIGFSLLYIVLSVVSLVMLS